MPASKLHSSQEKY